MNRFIFVLILFFNFSYGKKIEGYYLTINNEKFNTVFDIPTGLLSDEINFEAIRFVLKYYDENGEKKKLDLNLIHEVGFEYNSEKIVLRKLFYTLDPDPYILYHESYILLRLIKEDIISSYSISGTGNMPNVNSFGGGNGVSSYNFGFIIFVKKDGSMVNPSTGSFKKKMKKFFSDCPDLVEKINEKVFKRNQINEVIEYYKVNCYKD